MTGASSHPALAYPKGQSRESEQRQVRRESAAHVASVRVQVLGRDGWRCRVPWCGAEQWIEMAHLVPKGMGGDHDLRTTTRLCAAICHQHHQGPRGSLHSGDLRVEFESDRGADGPVRFSVVSSPPRTDAA